MAYPAHHLADHAVPLLAEDVLVAVLAVGHELHLVVEVDAAHVGLDPGEQVHDVALIPVVARVVGGLAAGVVLVEFGSALLSQE